MTANQAARIAALVAMLAVAACGFAQESGHMRLVGPNLAVYEGANGFTVQLARFPGAKHFWLCA